MPLAQPPVCTYTSSASYSPARFRLGLDGGRRFSGGGGGGGLLVSPSEGRAALSPLPCAVVEVAALVGSLRKTTSNGGHEEDTLREVFVLFLPSIDRTFLEPAVLYHNTTVTMSNDGWVRMVMCVRGCVRFGGAAVATVVGRKMVEVYSINSM